VTKPLVVVESPTKIRTLKKYLGNAYNIAATVGHIKDLPAKEMGIDIENGFKPQYKTIPGKQRVITSLKKAANGATDIYLAPDPDREGEAIAFHTATILRQKGRQFHRVLFHELTQKAIKDAMASPHPLHQSRYDAQQARRILDRLVGYQISPLLWRKIKGGLSAGRVQSVALRIICEREQAIQNFVPEEYWSITAHLNGDTPPPFAAKLLKHNGKKIQIGDAKSAQDIVNTLADEQFVISKISLKTVKRNPLPPFITSKMQQEAIQKLRFSAKKTMMIAQQLYEGVDLGPGEPEGLITYMRTDSTRISAEAAHDALDLIGRTFGAEYAPEKPRFFKNKNKVQDAHEAIRPTTIAHTPEKLTPFLSKDQLALYRLIWQRFVASQMAQALIDQKSIAITAGAYQFGVSGSTVRFPGFMALYMSTDEENQRENEKNKQILPDLTEKMVLSLNQLEPKQHFTQPPPRFSEASLVKELEENGIGRPSTYAAILSTIQSKGYVDLIKRYFHPTELGRIVNHLLIKSFPDLINVRFTAQMEDELDRVEAARINYQDLLHRFYASFKKELEKAQDGMLSMRGVGIPTDFTCPECQKHSLHVKMGKNGHYLACNGYPQCTYTQNYERDQQGKIIPIAPPKEEISDEVCASCGKPMVLKQGKFGPFLACSGYPACKTTRSVQDNSEIRDTGVKCPEAECDGSIVSKNTRRGKVFYGCNRYPACKFALWDKPVAKKMPGLRQRLFGGKIHQKGW
jgi:DNA topoisomerase-1